MMSSFSCILMPSIRVMLGWGLECGAVVGIRNQVVLGTPLGHIKWGDDAGKCIGDADISTENLYGKS